MSRIQAFIMLSLGALFAVGAAIPTFVWTADQLAATDGLRRGRNPADLTNAGLAVLAVAKAGFVVREGVDEAGDAPPLGFKLSPKPCSAADSYLEITLARGGCAEAVVPAAGIDVREEGAKFDGVTDDTAALQRAFLYAARHAAKLLLPAGTSNFSSMLSIPSGYKDYAIAGAGYSSVLRYDGSGTEDDLIRVGTPGSPGDNIGITLTGFRITSTTRMAGGAALHLWHVILSRIDPVIDGQDGNGLFHDGIWYDECDDVDTPYVDMAGASDDIVLINGSRRSESWWPNYVGEIRFGHGKITAANAQNGSGTLPLNGMHVAGGVGGLSIDAVDIIANQHNVTIDQAVTQTGNQTVTFGAAAYIDMSQHDSIVVNDDSPPGQWQGGTKMIDFDGWIASAGRYGASDPTANCVKIEAFRGGRILFRGNTVAACMKNGVDDHDATARVEISSSESFYDNLGYDIASAVERPQIVVTNARFPGAHDRAFDANVLTSTLPLYTGKIAMTTPVGLAIGGITDGIIYTTQRSYYQLAGNLVVVDYALNLASKGRNKGELMLVGLPAGETAGGALGGGGMPHAYTGWTGLTGSLDLSINNSGTPDAAIFQSGDSGLAKTFDSNLTDTATLAGELQYFR